MVKKVICALLIIFALLTSVLPAAAADVEYGDALEYVFNTDSKTDLFANFKKIMPGDHKTQVIVLQNTETDKFITIYLKAEIDEEYKEFLSWMTLSIYRSDSETGEKLLVSKGKASEIGTLSSDVKLSRLSPGQYCYITVELDVDKEMDNSQASKEAIIRWTFTCDEEVIKNKTHTVSFYTDKGEAPSPQVVEEGGKLTEPTSPVCEGYVFTGWYTDISCTKKYDFNSLVTTDLTLYAGWEEEEEPTTEEPTSEEPTSEHTTEKPTEKTTKPTTEPVTRQADNPFTGSETTITKICASAIICSIIIIAILKKKKDE